MHLMHEVVRISEEIGIQQLHNHASQLNFIQIRSAKKYSAQDKLNFVTILFVLLKELRKYAVLQKNGLILS